MAKTWQTLEEIIKASKGATPQRVSYCPNLLYKSETTLLAGREKSGKTTLMSYIMAQLTIGGEFLGITLEARDILLLQLEESQPIRNKRLIVMKSDGSRIVIPKIHQIPRDETWVEFIANIYDEHKFQGLIVDSLIALGTHVGILSENDNSAFQQKIFNPLRRFYERCPEVGTLFAHHSLKDRDVADYRGASAIGAGVDNILVMTTVKDEPRHRKFNVRSRVGNQGFTIELLGDCQDPFSDANDVSYALVNGTLPIEDQIISALKQSEHPLSQSGIIEEVKGRSATIRKELERFVLDGRIDIEEGGNGRANLYSLS